MMTREVTQERRKGHALEGLQREGTKAAPEEPLREGTEARL